jgi:hypothetical protein
MGKPKPAQDPAITALVDEIGDLSRELGPLAPKAARLDLLRKSLRKHYDEHPADGYYMAEGNRFSILVGPRENERRINYPALIKAAGSKLFQRIARVTLTALETEAPHVAGAPGVITLAATGHRSLKILEKGQA